MACHVVKRAVAVIGAFFSVFICSSLRWVLLFIMFNYMLLTGQWESHTVNTSIQHEQHGVKPTQQPISLVYNATCQWKSTSRQRPRYFLTENSLFNKYSIFFPKILLSKVEQQCPTADTKLQPTPYSQVFFSRKRWKHSIEDFSQTRTNKISFWFATSCWENEKTSTHKLTSLSLTFPMARSVQQTTPKLFSQFLHKISCNWTQNLPSLNQQILTFTSRKKSRKNTAVLHLKMGKMFCANSLPLPRRRNPIMVDEAAKRDEKLIPSAEQNIKNPQNILLNFNTTVAP